MNKTNVQIVPLVKLVIFFTLIFLILFFNGHLAYAQGFSLADSVNTEKAAYALLLILVLAILLETGLSTLFNWRIYLRYFEEKGMKVPIAVVSAFIFVNQFEIDAVAEVLGAFAGKTYDHGTAGEILTALIIAGGSSAIFTLFKNLGLRNPLERKAVAESMRTQCRLKIRLLRTGTPTNNKVVSILVDDKIVGAIDINKNEFGGILGHIIEAGDRKIGVTCRDKDGKEIQVEKTLTIAPGATTIASFQLTADALVG